MTEPEFIIQTGALGILAFGSIRMFALFGKMNESISKLTLMIGELLGQSNISTRNRGKRNGKARA